MKFRRSVRLRASRHPLVSPQTRESDTTMTNLARTGITGFAFIMAAIQILQA
jgi:hypothetical protein